MLADQIGGPYRQPWRYRSISLLDKALRRAETNLRPSFARSMISSAWRNRADLASRTRNLLGPGADESIALAGPTSRLAFVTFLTSQPTADTAGLST